MWDWVSVFYYSWINYSNVPVLLVFFHIFCSAFSIIEQGGYSLRKIDKWHISISKAFYVNDKESWSLRMIQKIFFRKHFKFQIWHLSFLMAFFNFLLVYRLGRTWEHLLLRHLAGFISMQPQIKFLTKTYSHYVLLNHIYSTYFMYLSMFVICSGL